MFFTSFWWILLDLSFKALIETLPMYLGEKKVLDNHATFSRYWNGIPRIGETQGKLANKKAIVHGHRDAIIVKNSFNKD